MNPSGSPGGSGQDIALGCDCVSVFVGGYVMTVNEWRDISEPNGLNPSHSLHRQNKTPQFSPVWFGSSEGDRANNLEGRACFQ